MKVHEQVLIFYRNPPTYNPQRSGEYTQDYTRKVGIWPSEIYGNKQVKAFYVESHPDGKLPQTVQYWGQVLNGAGYERLHPSQKPLAMLHYLIKTYTNEGEVVLDFCMGSGTTGVAAKETGRRFVGIEQGTEYYKIAEKRIATAARQFELLE